jgi:hypothetical protein
MSTQNSYFFPINESGTTVVPTDLDPHDLDGISDEEMKKLLSEVAVEVDTGEDISCVHYAKCCGLATVNTVQLKTSLDQGVYVHQYGIFHPKVLYNVITFKWVNIAELDNANNDLDLKAQKTNEYSNLGLLSALIFTVIKHTISFK